MSEKIKRSLRTLAILLTALVAVFVMFFTVACGDDESGDPFDGDIIQTDYDFIVKIIGTKTEEVKLKSGDTLVNHEPLAVPKKSGERFVGWYADGENTPYDWTRKVTKDMTIRARFEKVEGLKVVNGIAFPQTDGGISTGAKDTLAFIDDEFTRGSISASVTPVAANNDCGIVFGADIPDEGADWENFDYFIVIINKDGILIFAKIDSSQPQVNRWTPISESEILRASYDPSKTYNIKIGYDNGFCTVSVDGRLCLANDIGMLYGPSVGYRAQIGGTVFGPLTVDAEDLPSRPASGNYDALSGALIGTTDGAVECLVGNTIAVAKTEQTDRISFTMHGFANSDDGIVFGLTKPENGGEYWEGSETSYYFFFVGENGNARLAKIEGGWNEPFISVANVRVETADRIYKLEVLLDGNDINCFVNGVKVFGVTDSNKLTGTYYGVRAKTAGVTFKENDVADKHAVITDGANVGLMFVADGDTAEKPADPQKAGYVFDNWYVGDSQTPYDWATPVTDDMTITARFTDDESTDYIVTTGAVRKVSGGYETTADRTCVFTKDRFTEGTLTATVTPSVSNNDCGIIFGANLINSAEWENFNYFMVLINKDGVLLFARSPWQEISSVNLATKLGGFSASQAYSITVKYVAAGGYVEIYVNNQKMLSAVIGSLYGNRIGYRADKAGTLFYDYAIDANDKPTVPETNVGAYTVRSGRLSAGENGAVTTTEDNTLALLTSKSHGSIISFTMSRTTAADDGIVFGLTDNGAESYWQGAGTNYYFFFIDRTNNVRFAKVVNGAWTPLAETPLGATPGTYRLEAVIAGNTIHCFVNGVRFLSYTDADILGGVAYGIRAGATGVNYTENDTTGKHAVILESTEVTFMLVADGEAAQKPVDPVKQGFVFDDWYVGNSETPYDWTTPVTSDITVTAKFMEDNTADYTLTQGTVENSDYGIKTTKAETLVIMRNTTFTQGALEVKFKPTTKNDCGLVFGANVTTDAKWENFDYFTVLLNKNGTVLVARVNSWGVMASSAIVEGNFNPVNEYTVKVVYKSGYARVFVNNLLAATVYIGELKGSAVGFRAESVGTEFSDNVTVDVAATLDIGQAETDVTFVKRAGTQEMTVDNGTYTSTAGGTVYTSDNKILVRGGSVSVKINVSGAADKTQCNGIIFGVPSNSTSGDLWENSGDNYYFFFISDDGNVRFNTLSPWGVENDKGFFKVNTQKIDTSVEHTLTVSWDGNGVVCFVDGTMYFCADSVKYNGGVFGMRVQTAGVVYKDFTVVSYAESATTVATDD